MKLRLRDNSVRLRLTQSEVRQLAEQGLVEERVQFAGADLGWVLETAVRDDMAAWLQDHVVRVQVPAVTAREWAESQQVGLEALIVTGGGRPQLLVQIEKDFQCLDRPDETPDAFPHPTGNC